MKQILLTISTLVFSLSALAMTCTGEYEGNNEKGEFQVISKDLTVNFEKEGSLEMTVDIGDYHYNVQSADDRYVMMITLGPDYTRGVTASLTWDKDNTMRVTRVDGYQVYRLICKK